MRKGTTETDVNRVRVKGFQTPTEAFMRSVWSACVGFPSAPGSIERVTAP